VAATLRQSALGYLAPEEFEPAASGAATPEGRSGSATTGVSLPDAKRPPVSTVQPWPVMKIPSLSVQPSLERKISSCNEALSG